MARMFDPYVAQLGEKVSIMGMGEFAISDAIRKLKRRKLSIRKLNNQVAVIVNESEEKL